MKYLSYKIRGSNHSKRLIFGQNLVRILVRHILSICKKVQTKKHDIRPMKPQKLQVEAPS